MANSKKQGTEEERTPKAIGTHDQALLNMHKMFLDALRHREQDIIHFLAILGPALGGFIWLVGQRGDNPFMFLAGTYGVLFVLVMGAFYSLALGYNYRYLTLQLAKLEANEILDLGKIVLGSWPRSSEAFKKRSRWGVIPWSTPPGIIKVFWVAFLAGILGVTLIASIVPAELSKPSLFATTQTAQQIAELNDILRSGIGWIGGLCFALGLLWPVSVGRKMLNACKNENFEPAAKTEPRSSRKQP